MDVFSRYAPFIQDYIYSSNWQNLRAVQVAAAKAIFDTKNVSKNITDCSNVERL